MLSDVKLQYLTWPATSTIFSWPVTKWLPSVSKFDKALPWTAIIDDDGRNYVTKKWLKEQSELFYSTGIEKLQDRY